MIDISDYQCRILGKGFSPDTDARELTSKLAEEVGEAIAPVNKGYAGKLTRGEVRARLREELGDVCAFVSLLASYYNLSLEEILEANVAKVEQIFPP